MGKTLETPIKVTQLWDGDSNPVSNTKGLYPMSYVLWVYAMEETVLGRQTLETENRLVVA